jgi:hypothetical protein
MGYRVISTVVTPAGSYDLAKLADVKAELNISDTSSDTLLTRYIAYASTAVSQLCNRRLTTETVKDEIWPDREDFSYQVTGALKDIQLSRWPVVTLSSLSEDGNALADGVDFRIDKETGIVSRLDKGGYPASWSAWPIVATFTAGLGATVDDIPQDIQDATIRLVKARYFARNRDPILKSEDIPGVRSVQYWISTGADAGNMPPDVVDLLNNYRVPVIW